MIFSQHEIELWLNELGEKCDQTEWLLSHKLGYLLAINEIRKKMDDAKKAQKS